MVFAIGGLQKSGKSIRSGDMKEVETIDKEVDNITKVVDIITKEVDIIDKEVNTITKDFRISPFFATVVFDVINDDPPAMLLVSPPSPRRSTPSPRRSTPSARRSTPSARRLPPSPSFFEPKCILTKCK